MSRGLAASLIVAALAVLFIIAQACPLAAHDIPSDATVQMFFKPAGNHLSILVRVPLKTMHDI